MEDVAIEQRARLLCQALSDGIESSNLCTITTAIYDTAWLFMVSKSEGEAQHWLFPEAFQYLLSQQLPNGGWGSYATAQDGCLNSLAALLALKKHQRSSDVSTMLLEAIEKAIQYLENSLQSLKLDDSLQVGFEILVPALLSMLEEEGVYLSFSQKCSLIKISEAKMKSVKPNLFYGTVETTLLHSLEALIGKIDFDQISHRKTFGSMMASPASTAAYLMNVSVWDEEAEFYLRRVVAEGPGKGNGAVPSVFPTPIFESSWVCSMSVVEQSKTNFTLRLSPLSSRVGFPKKLWVKRFLNPSYPI